MGKKTYNIVEFFSGIGSQIRALNNIDIKCNVQAVCEWDIHAMIAYDVLNKGTKIPAKIEKLTREELIEKLSHYTLSADGKEPMKKKRLGSYSDYDLKSIYTAIIRTKNLVDISKISGREMPENTDILTYSFPCQDLSNVGAFHGYNKGIDKDSGSRSSLLWQVGRILLEMKEENKTLPKYLIMENVPSLLSPRHINNFEMWKGELEDLGYISKEVELNARWFGIPQNRPRLLMMSIYVGGNIEKKKIYEDYFANLTADKIIDDYKKSKYYHNLTIKDLLRIPKDSESKYWEEALECTPNDTPSRRKIWNENPKIIDECGNLTKEEFIRTLTTKQDRHPNSGNIYFDTGIDKKGKFRYLTPRECMLFMGFTDEDYENVVKKNLQVPRKLFPRDKIIRMAGNSIPVKLLEGFFYQLNEVEKI